ncbi:transposase [Novosphingobium sp. PhB165]|nr:transposase [Novosphingobium sp. PhB165]
MAESMEPGANVSAVARRHGTFPQQLYTWRCGLRERAEAMTFVPAMVEHGKVDELSGAVEPPVSGQIIVEASGLLIRIPPDVSADHIERVLLAARVSA